MEPRKSPISLIALRSRSLRLTGHLHRRSWGCPSRGRNCRCCCPSRALRAVLADGDRRVQLHRDGLATRRDLLGPEYLPGQIADHQDRGPALQQHRSDCRAAAVAELVVHPMSAKGSGRPVRPAEVMELPVPAGWAVRSRRWAVSPQRPVAQKKPHPATIRGTATAAAIRTSA